MRKFTALVVLTAFVLSIPLAFAGDEGIPLWGREVRQQLRELTKRVRDLERREDEAGILPRGSKLTEEERLALNAVAKAVRKMLSSPERAPWLFTKSLTPGQVATFRVLGEGLDRGRFGFRWTQAGVGKESSFYNCMWRLGSLFEHAHASGALKDDINRDKTTKLVEAFTSQLSSGNLERAHWPYRDLSSYLKYIVK